MLPETTLLSN